MNFDRVRVPISLGVRFLLLKPPIRLYDITLGSFRSVKPGQTSAPSGRR
jgi:hypothetical protein